MQLTINQKAKLIDVIILLNSRFAKLYSKALSIQRKAYLKQPIIKVNLDADQDHANFITIQLNFGIAENNSETKLNDFTLNLILPDDELKDMLENDNQYQIAESLQNEIIVQLIQFCKRDRFADQITDPRAYNDVELDTFGAVNFIIQKIIDSHYFNANSVDYVIPAIDNLDDGLLPYLKAVQTANDFFLHFDNPTMNFKIATDQTTTSDQGLIQAQVKNRKTLIEKLVQNRKALTKTTIEAYLFTTYLQHIKQEATILSANATEPSQATQTTLEILADFIYYSNTQQIKKHFKY